MQLPLDARLNEQVIMLPAGDGLREMLETTVFRPAGPGPFPLLLMNHGKQAGPGVTLSVEGRKLAASESVSGANANALKAAESRPNGVGLASELTDNLVYKAGFNLSANVVKAADQALGSLIDVKT